MEYIEFCLFNLYRIKILRKLIFKIIYFYDDTIFVSQLKKKIFLKYYNIKIGYGSYGGMYKLRAFKPGTIIGNYCSFANNIYQFNANHPFDNFTTHPITYYKDFTNSKKEELKRTNLTIGNDVWIGQNVIILPGCNNIGNGAIIGAGSVVTKNIPAYSIVVGNPARILKMRFSDNVIEKLEASKWWELKKEDLIKNTQRLQEIVNDK